jgi:hypothetical protein
MPTARLARVQTKSTSDPLGVRQYRSSPPIPSYAIAARSS